MAEPTLTWCKANLQTRLFFGVAPVASGIHTGPQCIEEAPRSVSVSLPGMVCISDTGTLSHMEVQNYRCFNRIGDTGDLSSWRRLSCCCHPVSNSKTMFLRDCGLDGIAETRRCQLLRKLWCLTTDLSGISRRSAQHECVPPIVEGAIRHVPSRDGGLTGIDSTRKRRSNDNFML